MNNDKNLTSSDSTGAEDVSRPELPRPSEPPNENPIWGQAGAASPSDDLCVPDDFDWEILKLYADDPAYVSIQQRRELQVLIHGNEGIRNRYTEYLKEFLKRDLVDECSDQSVEEPLAGKGIAEQGMANGDSVK